MRVAFTTLGCRLNQFETEGMRHRVERGGALDSPGVSGADGPREGRALRIVDWEQPADAYVINSCAVTARAEQKCRQLVRAVRRREPQAKVLVVGCYSQLAGTELAARLRVDAVLGNEEKRRLDEVLPRLLAGEDVSAVGRYRRGDAIAEEWIDDFGDHSRATIKVQEGCDLRCTFCAIWRARGHSRSRRPRDVVQQAQRLAAAGYEEIVLAGVHLGHYGRDLDPATDLSDLLDMLVELVDEKVRFRLSSLDPNEVDDRLIERLLSGPRVCRYLHLPLQSGSDAVLERMRRGYRSGEYRDLVRRIAARDPHFGFGADVIVGFPGETEEEFEATRALLDALPVSFYHVFRYSDREGTGAVRMGGKVPGPVSAARSAVLRELGERKARRHLEALVGRTLRGVVEAQESETGLWELRLDTYATVWVAASEAPARRAVECTVERMDERGRLRGRLVPAAAERIEAKASAR